MLLPRLRIRLNSAGRLGAQVGARVAKASALSGTKMKPRPSPWTMPVRMIAHWLTSVVKSAISQSENAVSARPPKIEQARIDAADQPADHDHGDHRADAARRQHQAGGDHRIAHQVLQERRQQRQRRQQDDADDEDEQQADDEVAVLEQRGSRKGRSAVSHLHEEEIEAEAGERRPR